ncbi:EAL domain-containing protein [Pseudomonas sp. 10B1]|nr:MULTISPECIES: EAL domain-containing protein [unclassified Pseudomonas]MDY7560875.1 EAL domain-containing protein [Pseudomonas sp. AB6]MEA9976457.1 EAL domain-containing protein [Pseudomonas sp. RTS4]MEA9996174.1 EAL domain-containing protein [Pseudomonas sp. AA4]MEB0088940.1 EAL domain-containing protein [Pseudomonas sp. RTI1]MEB0128050.1 EAL domain-containing protein [Pseudomonas sp. CCC1.2]
MKTAPVAYNRRILIIDDTLSIHQDFRKILCPELDSEQSLASAEAALFGTVKPSRKLFELDSAYQGEEALAMVESALAEGRPYSLAFIDMRMPPGWDGLETIERLWKVDPKLQVALCTAFSDHSLEAMTERLEFGDQLLILKKPFDTLAIRQMASALTVKWQLAEEVAAKMLGLEQTIAERVQEAMKVSHLFQYDVLTELPNSTLLAGQLALAIALSKRHDLQLAIFFIGLDRFERINNALGYPTGDEMLKQVAHCLVNTVRQSDAVFRYGSDEFVVILADIHHPHQTTGIAEKLLAALRVPHYIAGHDLTVTASLGISIFPNDGVEPIELIKKAENAMRNVKIIGPDNFCFFADNLNERAREHQSIESGIRLGLERDEFVLHYQPKLNLKTGKIVGAEALIRWLKPDHGWVFPSEFIPVAEDTGLIVPLSKWVLREACRQACAWEADGLPTIRISVNISATEFRQKGFLESIRSVLAETGLGPAQLELEITEGVLMQNADSTILVLLAIKEMGIRLAIDDFGTGYSSLSYLRRFPIDVLKIDQSFIRALGTDSNDEALVDAIISLGESLKLNIIAEGIETQAQLDFLRAHNCEEGQGYFFSRAIEPVAFAKILSAGKMEAEFQGPSTSTH